MHAREQPLELFSVFKELHAENKPSRKLGTLEVVDQLGQITAQVRQLAERHPIDSAFVYGSTAISGQRIETSDIEVGIIPGRGGRLSRRELAAEAPDLRIYVFSCEELTEARPRVPFSARIFTRELAVAGKTVLGAPVVEAIDAPAIRALDLFSDVRFSVGRAFEGLLTARAGQERLAIDAFGKSMLYGTRALLIARAHRFYVDREEIAADAEAILDPNHTRLLRLATKLRRALAPPTVQDFYGLLEFLTETVEPQLELDSLANGDRIVLERAAPRLPTRTGLGC